MCAPVLEALLQECLSLCEEGSLACFKLVFQGIRLLDPRRQLIDKSIRSSVFVELLTNAGLINFCPKDFRLLLELLEERVEMPAARVKGSNESLLVFVQMWILVDRLLVISVEERYSFVGRECFVYFCDLIFEQGDDLLSEQATLRDLAVIQL